MQPQALERYECTCHENDMHASILYTLTAMHRIYVIMKIHILVHAGIKTD